MVDIAAAAQEAATVRKATADELPQLAKVLTAAFADDPAARYVFGEDLGVFERAFLLFLRRIWFEQDECYTTANVAGTCIWERPGEWKLGVGTQVRLLPAMIRAFGRRLPKATQAITKMESNHPKAEHYYLAFVGVMPDWQGRGLGAALMRPVLERCDRDRLPAYLEASTPRNRALYERHGFAVTEEFRLGKGSPPLWRMWREPS
jgi:ribosomal protein S18 acetylase RimI-like enzyme